MFNRLHLFLVAIFLPVAAFAQGEDSTTYERDLQVISQLLEGGYDNANQSYFDYRTDRSVKHARIHAEVETQETSEPGVAVFHATFESQGSAETSARRYVWTLATDHDAKAVVMSVEGSPCTFAWRREAAQFTATAENCEEDTLTGLVLSERQLWATLADRAYELHRIRRFECYADIPGVGGGRDIPYDRYGGLQVHDQGGAATFTSKEGREITISLLLVDWPINNYEGVFTRDSLVIYVNEKTDQGRTDHGYAFTVPEADRIGINLKWMLAFCYMTPNSEAVPYM